MNSNIKITDPHPPMTFGSFYKIYLKKKQSKNNDIFQDFPLKIK